MALHAIILSGGHGTRLWPASRPERPKQFLPLLSERSMFQSTVRRMATATGDRAPIVVAGEGHALEIGRQLRALGDAEAVLLVEPDARDSAPAIAAAAAWIARHDPDGIGVMVASDHHLPDAEAFAAAVASAAEAAAGGAIVTFGVRPDGPSTAYGYIHAAEPLAPGTPARRVARFAEKPDAETARRYVADGWLWNSGNFVFRARTLLEELDRHAPEVARAAREAVAHAGEGFGAHRLGEAFLTAPKISIDYALMEKTDRAAVVPLEAEWSDLGAWDAVHAASPQDAHGNAAPADAVLHDSRGVLVRSATSQTVATVGLDRIAVIVEKDAVLVADLASAQGVKQVVDALKARDAASVKDPADALRTHARELGAWMRANALPLWWSLGADRAHGAFHELLDLEGRPVAASRRMRVQGRQTFVFAQAGARGWDGPWREAVAFGLDAIARRRSPDGTYPTLASAEREVLDPTVTLYDQAFVLLAWAWAQAAGVGEHEAEALALVEAALTPRANPHGGYREASDKRPWQSNPHMHLFETFQAWSEVGSSPRWKTLAGGIAELALARFIDPATGALREFFREDWSPAEGEDGRVVEPGHQFEWSWLLDRWGEAAGDASARAAALKLYEIGVRHGVDRGRGVALNGLRDDFSVADDGARLWPQTERLKAALRFGLQAQGETRRVRLAEAAGAARGLRFYFEGVPAGLWRDKLSSDGRFADEPAPASSLYHIAVAVAELEDAVARL